MSKSEKIPLLSASSRNKPESSFMLIYVPQNDNKGKSLVERLTRLENCSGRIFTVSTIIILFLLLLGIFCASDVSEITGESSEVSIKKLTVPSATLSQSAYPNSNDGQTEIETPLGRIRGYTFTSRKGREYFTFFKIPYAKPPVGKLRFKDPQPAEKWDGIRDFKEMAPSCIQKSKHAEGNITMGNEDCLYSTIHVPKTTDETKIFPVLVYVHGGGFGDGNGSRYEADYFMDEDVLVLTFEFRLGLFGFLNTGNRESTGNMGFKDQVMLLRFVKKYIKYFKGDPNKVTIFGNSSGGFSVSFLSISPMSNGLFHRAISQSGTVLCESTSILDLQPEVTTQAVARAFNCSQETSQQLLECLRNVDAVDLALLQSPDIKYALTVEKGFDPNNLSDVFMPDKPYTLLHAGKVAKVPYIMGIVSTEWLSIALALLKSETIVNNLNANFTTYAPNILGMDLTHEESDRIRSFYFGDKPISLETERNLTNLLSDRIMVHGTKVTADFHSLTSPTYLYYFSKRPVKSYADKVLEDFPDIDTTNAVSHADELQFMFPYFGYPEYPVSDTENFPFSELLVKLWANFADTGKPVIEGSVTDWSPVDANSSVKFWYELNDNPGPITVLDERMQLWDSFSHKQMMYDQ